MVYLSFIKNMSTNCKSLMTQVITPADDARALDLPKAGPYPLLPCLITSPKCRRLERLFFSD